MTDEERGQEVKHHEDNSHVTPRHVDLKLAVESAGLRGNINHMCIRRADASLVCSSPRHDGLNLQLLPLFLAFCFYLQR